MIYYPLQALINAGIRDILLVTGGNNAGDFLMYVVDRCGDVRGIAPCGESRGPDGGEQGGHAAQGCGRRASRGCRRHASRRHARRASRRDGGEEEEAMMQADR
jgi:hypothetical protein